MLITSAVIALIADAALGPAPPFVFRDAHPYQAPAASTAPRAPQPAYGGDPLDAVLLSFGPTNLHRDAASGTISGVAGAAVVSLTESPNGAVTGFIGGEPVRLQRIGALLDGAVGGTRVFVDAQGGVTLGQIGEEGVAMLAGPDGATGFLEGRPTWIAASGEGRTASER